MKLHIQVTLFERDQSCRRALVRRVLQLTVR